MAERLVICAKNRIATIFLVQQMREAQHIQSKMQEHYGNDAQQAGGSVVSQARAREVELIANIQNGVSVWYSKSD